MCASALHSHSGVDVSFFSPSVFVRPRSTVQDVLEYLPDSAHALGWQEDGVAERWYAAGPGATHSTT